MPETRSFDKIVSNSGVRGLKLIVNNSIPVEEKKRGEGFVSDFLKHFGIKGMRWGVRRANPSVDPPSDDSTETTALKAKIKTSGTQALSNSELQKVVSRMNLETQFAGLKDKEPTKISKGQNAIKKFLGIATTVQQVHSFANSPLGKDIAKQLMKKKS